MRRNASHTAGPRSRSGDPVSRLPDPDPWSVPDPRRWSMDAVPFSACIRYAPRSSLLGAPCGSRRWTVALDRAPFLTGLGRDIRGDGEHTDEDESREDEKLTTPVNSSHATESVQEEGRRNLLISGSKRGDYPVSTRPRCERKARVGAPIK